MPLMYYNKSITDLNKFMNGGIVMANRNHLGPNNEGPMTGRALGSCGANKATTDKETRDKNLGLGRGLGRGLGLGQGGRGRASKGFSINGRGNNTNNN